MSLNNFIPVVWSARLLTNLYKSLVYAQAGVVNRDYQGEINAFGDTVKITGIGAVTVGDYTKNSDMSAAETLTDAQTALIIEKAKYFHFQIDDVDQAQQNPKVMNDAMREAAYALADAADQYIAALMAAAVPSTNQVGSVGSPKTDLSTAANAYSYLVDLSVLLDNAKVPSSGRWVIVPPWFHGVLLKDNRFVGNGTPSNDATIRNAMIGEAAGFTVIKSLNVPNTSSTTEFRIMAGHPMATSFAEQVRQTEAYRPPLRFGDAVKGLHLYGGKVVRPSALAMLVANST